MFDSYRTHLSVMRHVRRAANRFGSSNVVMESVFFDNESAAVQKPRIRQFIAQQLGGSPE
jgi:hypothetical protein